MKLKKILLPALAIATTATPVVALTSCATAPEENTHFTLDSAVEKSITIQQTMPFAVLGGEAGCKFRTTEELKASDLKVTAEITSKNDYITLLECASQYKEDEKSLYVWVFAYGNTSAYKQEKNQELKFNIKIANGSKWYHLEKDFEIIAKKA